jgi:hypothetical protein
MEERTLIDVIAKFLGEMIERKLTKEEGMRVKPSKFN